MTSAAAPVNVTPPPVWAVAADLRTIAAAAAVGDLQPAAPGWTATLASGTPVTFGRLYAGAEFCRHLIPNAAGWAAVLALADRRGVPVTLRTPPVTDDDLPRLEALLTALRDREGAEVVVNDWGTLRLVAARFPTLKPLLGRCLRRFKKDPRIDGLPRPGAMAPELLELLAEHGVDLVEVDWLPDAASPLPMALHLPFAFVASGSLCALSGLSRPIAEKFRPDQPCAAPCRSLSVRLHHRDSRTPLLLHENTLFAPTHAGAEALSRPDVARLVYDLDTDQARSFLHPSSGAA
jgi:hypothetical protein